MYYFSPITHPIKIVTTKGRTICKPGNGAFLCLNPRCVSVKDHRAVQSRDRNSSLAITVSGLSYMLFKEPLSIFNPYINQSYTEILLKIKIFYKRKEDRDSSYAASLIN